MYNSYLKILLIIIIKEKKKEKLLNHLENELLKQNKETFAYF